MPLRFWHIVFDAAETLGVGAVVAAGVGAFIRLTRLPRWASALVAVAVCSALVHLALSEELIRVASLTLEGRFEHAIFLGYILFLGAVLPAATAVSAFLSTRRWLRLLPLVFALAILIGNHIPLPDDYLGIHIVFAWGAAMVGGAAVAPVLERAVLALRPRRAGRAALTAVLAFAIAGVVVPPPNAVRYELFRHVGAVAPWIFATTLWRAPAPRGPVPPLPPSPWFEDRAAAPAVPPARRSSPRTPSS